MNAGVQHALPSQPPADEEHVVLARAHPRSPREEKLCWICYESSAISGNSSSSKWIKPCACALDVHECCLLTWITEAESRNPSAIVKCPQCGTRYEVIETTSHPLLWLMQRVDKALRLGTPVVFAIGLGCASMTVSTTWGFTIMRRICGKQLFEGLIYNEDFSTVLRTCFLAPLLPPLMVSLQFRKYDALYPLLPLLFSSREGLRPRMPLPPALTLAVLPWIRVLYNMLYDRFVLPFDRHLTQALQPQLQPPPQEVQRDRDGDEEDDGREGDGGGLQVQLHHEERVINITTLVSKAIALPYICAVAGRLLAYFSFFSDPRKFLPLHRNLIGGCLFLLCRDAWSLYIKYGRAQQRLTRRVKG